MKGAILHTDAFSSDTGLTGDYASATPTCYVDGDLSAVILGTTDSVAGGFICEPHNVRDGDRTSSGNQRYLEPYSREVRTDEGQSDR
jgi:hypothetical protein